MVELIVITNFDRKGKHQADGIKAQKRQDRRETNCCSINIYYGGRGKMAKLDQQPLQSIRARGVRVSEEE